MSEQTPLSVVRGIRFPAVPGDAASRLLAIQHQLDRSQWLDAATLVERQCLQLRELLAFAWRRVPWYRAQFAELGLKLPEKLAPRSIQKLPILTRERIQEAGARLHAARPPQSHGRVTRARTSGSTGKPVEFLRTDVTRLLWRAFALRDHAWHQRDFSRKAAGIRWLHGKRVSRERGFRTSGWGSAVNGVYPSAPAAILHVAAPLLTQLEWLRKEQPFSLMSFPSNLTALAAHCLKHEISIPSLGEVRTVGETLSPQQRELIARAWGAKVVDLYSCEETGYIALQCPETDNYHVQSENVLLEIVDEKGQACPPGVPGRVLITSLHNFAMPLIRYEVGDIAESGEPCRCGRGLPVLRRIHGRRRNRIILPDGRSEFPYLGEHGQIEALTGVAVRQYQIVQHSVEEIELRLVADRAFTAAEAALVETKLRENLGHPFRIRFAFMDEIPKGPTGKYEEFISHVAT